MLVFPAPDWPVIIIKRPREAGVLLKIDQMPLFLLIAVVRTTVAFTVGGRQLVVETFKARDLVPAITQVAGGVH